MDCNRCGEELTAFLDGELSSSDSEHVRSHLQTCVSCSEEWRSLREVGEFVESHNRRLEPRAGSWNMVRARISQVRPEAPQRRWAFGRLRLAMAAVGLLTVFALAYLQYQNLQQRNLDQYMSRYERERKILLNSAVESYNPFIEIKATVNENPFRSEDR